MFARVITSQGFPGKQEEAARKWQEVVLPTIGQTPGFKGALMMSDLSNTRNMVITLWETEANAHYVDSSGSYAQAIDAMKDYIAAPPTVEIYKVNLQV